MGFKKKLTSVFNMKNNSKKHKKREVAKRENEASQESLHLQQSMRHDASWTPSTSAEIITAIKSLVSEQFADSGLSCMSREASGVAATRSTLRCNTRVGNAPPTAATRPKTARILSLPGNIRAPRTETRMMARKQQQSPDPLVTSSSSSSSESSLESKSNDSDDGTSSNESTSFFGKFIPKRSFSGVNQNKITKLFTISRGFLGAPNSTEDDQTIVMDLEEENDKKPIIPKVRDAPPPTDLNTMYKLMLSDPLRFRKLDGGRPKSSTSASTTSTPSGATLTPSSFNESLVWPKRETEKSTPYVEAKGVPNIKYAWKAVPESRHNISEKLYFYRTINEGRNIEKNGLQKVSPRNEEHTTPSVISAFGKTESVEEYLQNINNHGCHWTQEDMVNPDGEKRVRRKLTNGAYPNKTVAEDSLPRLLRYVWKGKYKKVLRYLKDKSKWEKANNQDKFGRTVLHYAASFSDYKMLKILLDIDGINPNIKDCHDKTPLFRAIEMQSLSCVRLLAQAGARARITCRDGRNALEYAITEYGDECFDIIDYLYNARGIRDVDLERPHMNLIHQAVVAKKTVNNKKVMKMLLSNATVDINAVEGSGKTALILAAMKNRGDLLKILLENKADSRIFDHNNKSTAHYLKDSSDGMKTLKRYG